MKRQTAEQNKNNAKTQWMSCTSTGSRGGQSFFVKETDDTAMSVPTTMEPKFLDTTAALEKFLSDLGDCDGHPPKLYVDLEGNNLSRKGTLSLVTILVEPERDVYLVDVTTFGRDAFTTVNADGRTLKAVLESKDIVEVFFDIRNDSDALFGLYEIRFAGIMDLQLMELPRGTS
ncbi:hypothetical protein LTR33_000578 [Friedmanniomyces endolithicus]|nr:hypothetical protein LTR33_000578 [Friedmanniomyces endolithicus]